MDSAEGRSAPGGGESNGSQLDPVPGVGRPRDAGHWSGRQRDARHLHEVRRIRRDVSNQEVCPSRWPT